MKKFITFITVTFISAGLFAQKNPFDIAKAGKYVLKTAKTTQKPGLIPQIIKKPQSAQATIPYLPGKGPQTSQVPQPSHGPQTSQVPQPSHGPQPPAPPNTAAENTEFDFFEPFIPKYMLEDQRIMYMLFKNIYKLNYADSYVARYPLLGQDWPLNPVLNNTGEIVFLSQGKWPFGAVNTPYYLVDVTTKQIEDELHFWHYLFFFPDDILIIDIPDIKAIAMSPSGSTDFLSTLRKGRPITAAVTLASPDKTKMQKAFSKPFLTKDEELAITEMLAEFKELGIIIDEEFIDNIGLYRRNGKLHINFEAALVASKNFSITPKRVPTYDGVSSLYIEIMLDNFKAVLRRTAVN